MSERAVNMYVSMYEVSASLSNIDRKAQDRFFAHLAPLQASGLLHQCRSSEEADIVVFLVSADWLASQQCQDEMRRVFQRGERDRSWVIPVLLRPADVADLPIAALRPLPLNGKPVSEWDDPERAFVFIAKGIKAVALRLRQGAASPPSGASDGPSPLDVYVAYDDHDGQHLRRFARHLEPLQAAGKIRIRWPLQLLGGEPFAMAERWLRQAHLIVLPLSADFLAEPRHRETMRIAMERHRTYGAVVLPVLVRPIVQIPDELMGLRCLPSEDRAISEEPDEDRAWSQVIREILTFLRRPDDLPDAPEKLPEWAARATLGDLRSSLNVPTLQPGESPIRATWERLNRSSRLEGVLTQRFGAEVPGPLAVLAAAHTLGVKEQQEEVVAAIGRLGEPDSQSTGCLATDLIFLRMVAAAQPIIDRPIPGVAGDQSDLRQVLPDVFVRVLGSATDVRDAPLSLARRLSRRPSRRGQPFSLASVENATLRMCAQIVDNLSAGADVSLAERLLLMHQLAEFTLALTADEHAWRSVVHRAPAPLPPATAAVDLLYPMRFGPRRFPFRLAGVLHALGPVYPFPGSVEMGLPPLRSVTSTSLEALLLPLAGREPTEDDLALKERGLGSCLGWAAHDSLMVPELALGVLLFLNDSRFFDLEVSTRRRYLSGLGDASSLWRQLLPVLARHAGQMDADERSLLRARLQGRLSSSDVDGWWAMIGLFGAGEVDLGDDLNRLFSLHLRAPEVQGLLGRYFQALSAVRPGELATELASMLAAAASQGVPARIVFGALARLLNSADGAMARHVRRLMHQLTGSPPYAEDPEIQRLAQQFSLP